MNSPSGGFVAVIVSYYEPTRCCPSSSRAREGVATLAMPAAPLAVNNCRRYMLWYSSSWNRTSHDAANRPFQTNCLRPGQEWERAISIAGNYPIELLGRYTGLASITLTEPRVRTTAVNSNPAAERRSWNPDLVRTRPPPPPYMLSMSRSLATVSQKRKPSRGSLPAGITHSISNTFPFSAMAFRQLRSGMTAWASCQMTRKFDRT